MENVPVFLEVKLNAATPELSRVAEGGFITIEPSEGIDKVTESPWLLFDHLMLHLPIRTM